eukprot:TRINITY_DN40578_c0_g1_i1.p1 TRINITY_DN40578_c0_g1~~TRINITY_DN40578_c0_g1_i1.p1  ORF type:complete len:365 (-),score=47.52 TRINITY_DN40578_c0_g1_i1:154-1248(-)
MTILRCRRLARVAESQRVASWGSHASPARLETRVCVGRSPLLSVRFLSGTAQRATARQGVVSRLWWCRHGWPANLQSRAGFATTSGEGEDADAAENKDESEKKSEHRKRSGDKEAAPGKKKTYYDVLGVTRKATPEEVKEAYRRLAKKYHPDRNVDDPDAENRFKEVQEAHATLSDKWKRAIYDQDCQFGQYGTASTQSVDKEKWTEHWDRETPDERDARRERYRRYARGERNDLPPEPWVLRRAPLYALMIVGTVFYVCIKAPDWFDGQSDASHCDPAFDDKSVPLVRAFHDPVLDRWERLPEGQEAPTPDALYAYYRKARPDIMEFLDLTFLPKVSLTSTMMPRTETVKAVSRKKIGAAILA